MNGVTAQTWKALQCLNPLLTFKQAECRVIWDPLAELGSQLEGLQGKPRVFITRTQGGKNLTAALYSHWWYVSRNLNYTRVLRNSWKGRLSSLGVQICCLETLLWVWIQFSAAAGKLLFSGPAWGDHISQGTFPFAWVVSAPWKEDYFYWEMTHNVHGAHVGQYSNTTSSNISRLCYTGHGSLFCLLLEFSQPILRAL